MEKETLKYIVDEVRNMTRDLTVYEMRPEIEAHKNDKLEAINELRKATELAEKLAAEVAKLSVQVLDGNASEKDRQITAQREELERLEGQVEAISSDLDATREELSMINDGFKKLKLVISLIIHKVENEQHIGNSPLDEVIGKLRSAIAG